MINEFGDILCESSINLNDLIEDASIYQNSLSQLNAIIPIGNNEFLLLGNYVVERAVQQLQILIIYQIQIHLIME